MNQTPVARSDPTALSGRILATFNPELTSALRSLKDFGLHPLLEPADLAWTIACNWLQKPQSERVDSTEGLASYVRTTLELADLAWSLACSQCRDHFPISQPMPGLSTGRSRIRRDARPLPGTAVQPAAPTGLCRVEDR